MKVNILLVGLINVYAEIERVNKLIETANKEIIINKERDTFAANQHKLEELQGQLVKLKNMQHGGSPRRRRIAQGFLQCII